MGKHHAHDETNSQDGFLPVLTITDGIVAEIVSEALTVYALRQALPNDTRQIARMYGQIAAVQCQSLRETVSVFA